MFRLLLIFIALGFIIYGADKFKKNKHKIDKTLILKISTGVLLVLCVLLVLTGRAHWVAALAAGVFALLQRLVPLLLKFLPFIHQQYKKHQKGQVQGANQSEVRTDILVMILDPNSGHLDGEVLAGDFVGKHLSELDKEQLEQLYDYCCHQDEESAQLLGAYMQKRFMGRWKGSQQYAGSQRALSSTEIDRKEALSILALEEGVTDEEIIQAHRKLIQKIHPDRGGSDYLAAKVNEAKRVLLGK